MALKLIAPATALTARGHGKRKVEFRMRTEPTRPRDGIVVAQGYGLKIHVERGHLVIHDGIGDYRQVQRYHRATSRLKRVVVIGHTGYITLEALRWITDVGAAFAQIGSDGELIATSAPARHHESKLRRAQALAADCDAGRAATVALLRAKLERQAILVRRLAHLRPTVRIKSAAPVTVAAAIRDVAAQMHNGLDYSELRRLESSAGRNYWQTWARLPVRFHPGWRNTVPAHWNVAGPRTSAAEEKKRARKATSPVHAILNYSYAILETEATIAAHKLGFDPSLGVMHSDQRYRSNLATDLMEPCRPTVDGLVLDLLERDELRRGDVFETREGVCRIGPPLARRLSSFVEPLRCDLGPFAEQLARILLARTDHPTPLTRQRHRAALAARPAIGSTRPESL